MRKSSFRVIRFHSRIPIGKLVELCHGQLILPKQWPLVSIKLRKSHFQPAWSQSDCVLVVSLLVPTSFQLTFDNKHDPVL